MANLTSLELNKTIRANQKHYGSFVEPFCGLRYIKMESIGQAQQYLRYDEETALPVPVVLPVPLADAQNATIEQLISDTSVWANHMVGGQVGMRWFKQKSRWILSSDVRAFAFRTSRTSHSMKKSSPPTTTAQTLGSDVITRSQGCARVSTRTMRSSCSEPKSGPRRRSPSPRRSRCDRACLHALRPRCRSWRDRV